MLNDGQQLLPVDKKNAHYVVSDDWIKADVHFPDLSMIKVLVARGYRRTKGHVHHDGSVWQAVVYEMPSSDSQAYAHVQDAREDQDFQIERGAWEQYSQSVRELYAYTEGTIPEQRAKIDSQFVEPELEATALGRVVSWGELKHQNHLLITGAPGSGKTTLLRQWLLWHAGQGEDGPIHYVPVCLSLRHANVEDGLQSSLKKALGELNSGWLTESLGQLAKSGRLAIGFDGVDEVPLEDRQQLLSQMREFTSDFPECRYLVTSRSEVEVRLPLGLERCEIRPFDLSRRRELAYRRLPEGNSWKRFSARVEAEKGLGDLMANPLALSLVLARYIRKDFYPAFITEVVSSLVVALIDTWDSSRGIVRTRSSVFSPALRHKILSILAEEAFDSAQVVEAQLHARVSKIVPGIPAKRTLELLAEHTGLISMGISGGWSFRSRLVQDYFLANSWVSSLRSKVSYFLEALTGPVVNSGSTLARFMGFMSSDASYTIDDVLKDAKSSDLSIVVHLTDVLAQKIVLSSGTLDGYVNLSMAAIEGHVAPIWMMKGENSDDEAIGVVIDFDLGLLSTSGQQTSQLVALPYALYRGRDGMGGEALRDALRTRATPFCSLLGRFLDFDGTLSVELKGNWMKWIVRPL